MKFKVGDVCRLKYIRTKESDEWNPGIDVVIKDIYSGASPGLGIEGFFECVVGIYGLPGHSGYVLFDQLEPRQPPQELSTWEQVQKDTGWNPTKQKVTQ